MGRGLGVQLKFRLGAGLHEYLASVAEANGHSVSEEIRRRLSASIEMDIASPSWIINAMTHKLRRQGIDRERLDAIKSISDEDIDTSDIPEAGEAWFAKARLVKPDKS